MLKKLSYKSQKVLKFICNSYHIKVIKLFDIDQVLLFFSLMSNNLTSLCDFGFCIIASSNSLSYTRTGLFTFSNLLLSSFSLNIS